MPELDIPDEQEYRETIETAAEEIADDFAEGEEVSEYVFEEADLIIGHESVETHIGYLLASEAEPGEWKHLVQDGADWKRTIEAMAFTVVRMDLYDELRERGVDGV